MRKFVIEVNDNDEENLAINIEMALDGIVGEPSIDYIVGEVMDDGSGDGSGDDKCPVSSDDLVDSICEMFGVNPKMMSVRVDRVKQLLKEVL